MTKISPAFDFKKLMQSRVTRILIVCSSYDYFTIEEDGRIEKQVHSEYTELSLSEPPRFTRVNSGRDALELLKNGAKFDLVFVMLNIGEMSAFEFSREFKKRYRYIPMVLLTSFSHEITRLLKTEDTSAIDYVFSWQGNAELIFAIIKMVEDRLNAERDILEYGVQAVLLVEDSVRFYSAYLPDLYKIVLTQTNDSSKEALNEFQRKLRKRARPKILFARTYQEALEFYDRYNKNLLGVISDVSFPMEQVNGHTERGAGLKLCDHIAANNKRIPIILQSSEEDMGLEAKKRDIGFIYKHSSTLLEELKKFVYHDMFFGAISFKDIHTRQVIKVATDLASFQEALETIPDDTLLHYSSRNSYSKWLYARGLFGMANEIKEVFIDSFNSVDELRGFLLGVIKSYRRAMGQGVIAEFSPKTYNGFISFARCGNGSLGGKARGLAFVASIIEKHNLYNAWEGVQVTIPRMLAVCSGYFEEFMENNGLYELITDAAEISDNDILNEFIGSRLPEQLISELRIFLKEVHRPLAVRSSSKLEDSHYQPFAGIYSTYMVPRTGNIDAEVRIVSKAIKSVYASVFFRASRAYINSTSNVVGEESMGVVIQEISGSEDSGLFFPTFSGVARSLNFYPIGDEKPEDGVCDIAMGLGKAVVEGGALLRFSPVHPKHTLQLSTMESTLRDTQRYFYAMDMNISSFKSSTDDGVNIKRVEVRDAVKFRNMRYVASTWDMANNRIADHFNPMAKTPGRPLISFASILKYNTFPLADIITKLLKLCENEIKSPVEIEFAVNMDVERGKDMIFNFLQIRPMTSNFRGDTLKWDEVDTSGGIIYAENALGVGAVEGLDTIVYIKSENFDAAKTREIADEIETINKKMEQQGRRYILVGPGRWGSSDSWLGVPVKWAQISESAIIVEYALSDFQIDPSQGTHFFQNLTSLGVGYLTINPKSDGGYFNSEELDGMQAEYESEMVRVVRFAQELYSFVDGRNSKAIVRR
ncbi:MAG: PEP/pyruvate-binding domain-containing protein [Rikenellaceae bacterium]